MKVSKVNKLLVELDDLKVGEYFYVRPYVRENWERFDSFTKRSFSVAYCNAKKLLPNKKFKDNTITITRIL